MTVSEAHASGGEPDPDPDPDPCEGDDGNDGSDCVPICTTDIPPSACSTCPESSSGNDSGGSDCPGDPDDDDDDDDDDDCENGCGSDVCIAPDTGNTSPFTTKNPVYLRYGSVVENAVDLRLRGPGISWRQVRSYNSNLSGATLLGNRWVSENTDQALKQDGNDIELVNSASSKAVFESDGLGGYKSPQGWSIDLVHESGSSQYVVTNRGSRIIHIFHDFTVSPIAKRGRLKEVTREAWLEAGKSGLSYSYDGGGNISQLTTADGQALNVAFTRSNGKLTKIEVKDGSTVIKQVDYTYYQDVSGISTDVGSTDDLVQVEVKVKDSDDNWINSYTQYRYDSNSRIEGVFSNDSIQQIMAAGDTSVDTALEILKKGDSYQVDGDASIEKYASKWFTYYTSNASTSAIDTPLSTGTSNEDLETDLGGTNRDETDFVKTERVGSCGCSSCGGSDGVAVTYHYFYMELDQGTEEDDNEVKYLIVEDAADADANFFNRRVYGLNSQGRKLREVFAVKDPGTTALKYWCKSSKLTETSEHTTAGKELKRYRVVESRPPSAHDVASLSDVREFLDPYDDTGSGSWTNDTNTLRDKSDIDAGPTYTFEYNDQGRLTARRIKRGYDDTTEDYVFAREYGDGTTAPEHVITAIYQYSSQTTTKTAGDKWTITYDYWDSGKKQLRKKTSTWPIISASENGSGVAATGEEYYDKAGRLRWTKTAEGYVNYYSYDKLTGKRGYTAIDVDPTSLPSSASDSQWVSPDDDGDGNSSYDGSGKPNRDSGLPDELELVTTQEYDIQGRKTLLTNPGGDRHYTIYEVDRTIHFPQLDSSGKPQLPIRVVERNDLDQVSERYSVRADYSSVSTAGSPLLPTGFSTEPSQSDYVSWTRYSYLEDTGKVTQVDTYHDIPDSGTGTVSTNFNSTAYQYDSRGRREYIIQQVSGTPTSSGVEQVSKTTYDELSRVAKIERGVSAAGHNMGADYDNYPTLETVSEVFYDGGDDTTPLKVGDNRRTTSRSYYGTGTSDYVQSDVKYTMLGHVRGVERKNGTTAITPYAVQDINWQGRVTVSAQYTTAPNWTTVLTGDGYTDYVSGTSGGRNNMTKTLYNSWGKVYRTERYPGTATTNYFEVNNYYDRNGRLVATGDKYSAHQEYAYDGAGRQYQQRTVEEADGTYTSGVYDYVAPAPHPAIASMSSTGDDGLIEFSHTVYGSGGNVTEQHTFEMNRTDTDGIDIDATDSYVRSSTYMWYDDADRLETMANYGAGDGDTASADSWKYTALPTSAPTEPTTSTAAILVTTYDYDDETGRQNLVTDPEGTETKTFYDDLGRRAYVAENYTNFDPDTLTTIGGGTNHDEDRVTGWEHNGLGQTTKLTAYNASSSTGDQVTEYKFEDAYNAALVTKTIYPDGDATNDNVQRTYNLDGSLATMTDQRGVVHTYSYNDRRQLELDAASNLPGIVDDDIEAIGRTYDTMGRLTHITSYEGATTSTTVANEIVLTYNAYGIVDKSEQEHDGAVDNDTPEVTYYVDNSTTSNIFNDQLRVADTTYPNGNRIGLQRGNWNPRHHNDSLDDRLGRAYGLRFDLAGGLQQTKVSYKHNGTSRLAIIDYKVPDIDSNKSGSTATDFSGWDRFGRTVRQDWKKYGVSPQVNKDKFYYTYDYAGNRLTRDIPSSLYSSNDKDQAYSYDGLHRLKDYDEGTLSGTSISGTPKAEKDYTLDQLGNWSTVAKKTNGTTDYTQTRTHNVANEISTISGALNPTHDAAGNMVTVPSSKASSGAFTLTYDAWNRVVRLDNNTAGEVQANEYDGLNRRIIRDETGGSGVLTHFYYNQQWQVLEERVGNATTADKQYVYHPHYVDAVAMMLDVADNDKEYYYLHDANFNVTAVIDDAGDVEERYAYTPYGEVTVLDQNFSPVAGNTSTIGNEYMYTGRRLDPETGLQLNRRRFYASHLGRWVNRDPIAYDAGLWNLYNYNISNPLRYMDPYGLASCGEQAAQCALCLLGVQQCFTNCGVVCAAAGWWAPWACAGCLVGCSALSAYCATICFGIPECCF